MSSSVYVFDSHEHDVSEFPHTLIPYDTCTGNSLPLINNVSIYQHAMQIYS
jgi:hypothetical protein